MINRYIANQQVYVAEKKKQPLLGFTTPTGEQATWEDIAIIFTNDKGICIHLLFNNSNQTNARLNSVFTDKDRLDTDTHNLLFSYALDVLKKNTSINTKRCKLSTARKFLITLNKNISSSCTNEIQHAINERKNIRDLMSFFDWLIVNKMLPSNISLNLTRKVNSTRMKSGDDAIDAENSKLPDEKVLLALGAIFYDRIPPYQNDKENTKSWASLIHPTNIQLDSYTCTMSALAMAAPNRVAAEQVLLTKQRLQSHKENVNNKGTIVHYLDWRGSKGFKDNQKHINVEMAESLDRALHYTSLVTEPARVLARFYQSPHLNLNKILDNFEPNTKNINMLKPNYNKPTNLIQLGFLLGFFDNTDGFARVTGDTNGAINITKHRYFPVFIKHISKLSFFDKLEIKGKCPYVSSLVGARVGTSQQIDKYYNGQNEMTISEFQNYYIKINQQAMSGFARTKSKRVDYTQALFTYTKMQLSTQQASHFLLVPIESLSEFFKKNIKKGENGYPTIFERHGFSANFSMTPHQFRHWQNHYLAKKGLPHLLITMLSGRKNPEQTLTYIHTTDAQNASVVGDILYERESEGEREHHVGKRIQSKVQYDEAINNLSPTFINEVGFCTQDLTLTPCTYMTEFETQCTLCSSSCHITHDKDAIDLLKKDLTIQKHNLKQVQEAINFATNTGMQEWYQTHYRNTCMIKNLIDVLSDKSIKEGFIVRFLTRSNVMRITDLETKTVTEKKLSLPDEKEALQAAIEAVSQPVDNSAKTNFLDFLGNI